MLEDLHWADPDTLSIVEYFSDNLDEQPILCIATIRMDEATEATSLLHRLQSRRAAAVIELSRLNPTGVAQMARACLHLAEVPPDLLQWLRERSEGLPLLIEELLAFFDTEEPADTRAVPPLDTEAVPDRRWAFPDRLTRLSIPPCTHAGGDPGRPPRTQAHVPGADGSGARVSVRS